MNRDELLKDPVYWTAEYQNELYRHIDEFMRKHQMNKTQLAEFLGCTKGYVTQLLNGDFDHKLSKFIELSLAIGQIPQITFRDADEYIEMDKYSFSVSLSIAKGKDEDLYRSDLQPDSRKAA